MESKKIPLYYWTDNKNVDGYSGRVFIQGFLESPVGIEDKDGHEWRALNGPVDQNVVQNNWRLIIAAPKKSTSEDIDDKTYTDNDYYYELPDKLIKSKEFSTISFCAHDHVLMNNNGENDDHDWSNKRGPNIHSFGESAFENCEHLKTFHYENHVEGVTVTLKKRCFFRGRKLSSFLVHVPYGTLSVETEALCEDVENWDDILSLSLFADTIKFPTDGTSAIGTSVIHNLNIIANSGKSEGNVFGNKTGKERIGILKTNIPESVINNLGTAANKKRYFNQIQIVGPLKSDTIIKLANGLGYNSEDDINKQLIIEIDPREKIEDKWVSGTNKIKTIEIGTSLIDGNTKHCYESDVYNYCVLFLLPDINTLCTKVKWVKDHNTVAGTPSEAMGYAVFKKDNEAKRQFKYFIKVPGQTNYVGCGTGDQDSFFNLEIGGETTAFPPASRDPNTIYITDPLEYPSVFAGTSFKSVTINDGAQLSEECFAYLQNCKTITINGGKGFFNGEKDNNVFSNCVFTEEIKIRNQVDDQLKAPCFINAGRLLSGVDLKVIFEKPDEGKLGPQILPTGFLSYSAPELNQNINLTFESGSQITTILGKAFDNKRQAYGNQHGSVTYSITYSVTAFPDSFHEIAQDIFTNPRGSSIYVSHMGTKYLVQAWEDQQEESKIWILKFPNKQDKILLDKDIDFTKNDISVKDQIVGIANSAFADCFFELTSGTRLDGMSLEGQAQYGLTLGQNLRAISTNAFKGACIFPNKDSSITGDNGIGFNFEYSKLNYLGPGALDIIQLTSSQAESLKTRVVKNWFVALPINYLDTIYLTSLPLNSTTFSNAEILLTQIKDDTTGVPQLSGAGEAFKKWLSLDRLLFEMKDNDANEYCKNIIKNKIRFRSRESANSTTTKLNDMTTVLLGYDSYSDYNDKLEKDIKKYFYLTEESYSADNTAVISGNFSIKRGALVNNQLITRYYINLDNITSFSDTSIGLSSSANIQVFNCTGKNNKQINLSSLLFMDTLYESLITIKIPSDWVYSGNITTDVQGNRKEENVVLRCLHAEVFDTESKQARDDDPIKVKIWLNKSGGKSFISVPDLPVKEGPFFSTSSFLHSPPLEEGYYKNKGISIKISNLKQSVIQEYCFEQSNLIYYDISINEGLRRIDAYAFQNCDQLSQLYLPTTLQSIGENAFIGCTRLNKIVYDGKAEDWYKIVFENKGSCPFVDSKGGADSLKGYFFEEKEQPWRFQVLNVPKKDTKPEKAEYYDPYPFYRYPIKGLVFDWPLKGPIFERVRYTNTPGIEFLQFNSLPEDYSLVEQLFSDYDEDGDFKDIKNSMVETDPSFNSEKNPDSCYSYANLRYIYIGNNAKALPKNTFNLLDKPYSYNRIYDKNNPVLFPQVILPNTLEIIEENALQDCKWGIKQWDGKTYLNGEEDGALAEFAELKVCNRCGLDAKDENPNVYTEPCNGRQYQFFNNGKHNLLLSIKEDINVSELTDDDKDKLKDVSIINLGCIDNSSRTTDGNKNNLFFRYLYLPFIGSTRDASYIPEITKDNKLKYEIFSLASYLKNPLINSGDLANDGTRFEKIKIGDGENEHNFDPVITDSTGSPIFTTPVFEGVYLGTQDGARRGELIIALKNIIKKVYDRRHFATGQTNKDPGNAWPFDLRLQMETVPENLLCSDPQDEWVVRIENLYLDNVKIIETKGLYNKEIKNIYINLGQNEILKIKNQAFLFQKLNLDYIYFNGSPGQLASQVILENESASPFCRALKIRTNYNGETYSEPRILIPDTIEFSQSLPNIGSKAYIVNNYFLYGNRQFNAIDLTEDSTLKIVSRTMAEDQFDLTQHLSENNFAIIELFNGDATMPGTQLGILESYYFKPNVETNSQKDMSEGDDDNG